jgi:hypothetical protein
MKITQEEETIDLCFLMDATGSMGSWIAQTKVNILKIIDDMKTEHPNQKIRLGIVAYRDYSDKQLLEVFSFSEDYEQFKQFVAKIQATGGGDGAEDVFSGLNAAIKLDWSSSAKMLVFFADAPCHGEKYHTKGYSDYHANEPHKFGLTAEDLLQNIIKMEIDFSFMKITNDTDIMIQEFKKIYDDGNRIIQVQDAKISEEQKKTETMRMYSEGVSDSYVSRKKKECKSKGMDDKEIEKEESKWRSKDYMSTYVTEELEEMQNVQYQNVVKSSISNTRKNKGWFSK